MKIKSKATIIKRLLWTMTGTVVAVCVCLMVLNSLYPLQLTRYHNTSPVVLDKNGKILRAFTVEDGLWRLPVSYADISPNFLQQLVAFEDKRYWTHHGVDVLALARAVFQAVEHGRIVSGGSTLTMQTVRLLEPRPRTIGSKLIEMFRAVQLERVYSKQEILQIYATLAPYGGNVEGVRAASLQYFNKEPKFLTPAEAALLVVLPQSPTALRPDLYPKRALAARNKVLTRVLQGRAQAEALSEPLQAQKYAMPFLAPHLTRRLALQNDRKINQSFVAPEVQKNLTTITKQFVSELNAEVSAAILVVRNDTSEVEAYIGSADFFNPKRDGQVDMVSAIRSPGSTLKPFIYGVGFEDRMIHPLTTVYDVPTLFGDYAPKNFMRDFAGAVSVATALQLSLNVPAVTVLDGIGPRRFSEIFARAGAPFVFPSAEQVPALPIALGGTGQSLEKLVMLYAAIARGGDVLPLVYDMAGERHEAIEFLSAETAGYLKAIMLGTKRPTGFVSAKFSGLQRKMAYKTGTSYGYRDAWAIGLSNTYTIGVWVGRPDGTPHYNFIGLDAAKLLLQAFDTVLDGKDETELVTVPISERPAGLSVFPRKSYLSSRKAGTSQFRIMFPPKDAMLELSKAENAQRPIVLKAKSGKRPYKWMVNGKLVGQSLLENRFAWTPSEPGAYKITAIDQAGAHDTVRVWLSE